MLKEDDANTTMEGYGADLHSSLRAEWCTANDERSPLDSLVGDGVRAGEHSERPPDRGLSAGDTSSMIGRANWRDVPIPERMKHLDRDARGLPIPYIVLRHNDGSPVFTANDTAKVQECIRKDLCAISGQKLLRGRWFVGGPMSAFHPEGWYLDTPLHFECMRYAMQVCPYIAASKYTGRLDDSKIDPAKLDAGVVGLLDSTVLPDRPKLFVAVMSTGQEVKNAGYGTHYIRPARPYRNVEFWQHGNMLTTDEGMSIVADVMNKPLPQMRADRHVLKLWSGLAER